jgi:diguanylate cyclase (GGDEF)-like protein
VPQDHNETPQAFSPQSLDMAIAAAGKAAYHWSIANDALRWSGDAAKVLQRQIEAVDSGKKYASQLDADNMTSRYDAVMNSASAPKPEGVPFLIEYALKGKDGEPLIWFEDRGCWFPDVDGRPKDVFGVVHQITDRHAQDQELSYLSHNDSLTGMMNRGRMTEALNDAIAVAENEGTPCAFAVAAINNLDVINEAYGFDVADEVIAAVARRLRQVMRSGDGIGRYSGGKFGIILNSCARLELNRALDRFLLAVRDGVIETKHGPVWALLSIGAVSLPESASGAAEAMAKAEESLSRALRQPSDDYDVFQHSEARDTQRMLNARCATEIIECLKNGVFHLAYQPVVNAETGAVEFHEALLRMRDTAGEFVAAGHLVPVAERLGLIRLIDRAVVQLAIETLHRFPEARISINISATTANDARWNSQLIDMIASAAPLNERLIVEITETTALADLSVAIAFFEKLRDAGCCIAIDDFGAGFTSFRNLRDLPVDIIKLDGSYCRNLGENSENAYFAKTLIDMAHRFGIKTVAEWVESAEDAASLTLLGIDYLQGNHIGAPAVAAPWKSDETPAFAFEDGDEAHALAVIDENALFSEGVRASEQTKSEAPFSAAIAIQDSFSEAGSQALFELIEGENFPVAEAQDEETAERAAALPELAEVETQSHDLDHVEEPEFEVQGGPEAGDDAVFQDAEDSLSKLRAALDELSKHFQPGSADTANSDAAPIYSEELRAAS